MHAVLECTHNMEYFYSNRVSQLTMGITAQAFFVQFGYTLR